jgi:sugar lactone lactonase YvrE
MYFYLRTSLILTTVTLLAACSEPQDQPATPPQPRQAVPPPAEIAAADAQWQMVAAGYVYSDAPAVNAAGEIYYTANTQNRIFHLDSAGAVNLFDENTAMTMGLMFGPDGRLYGCRNKDAQIIAYDMQGGREVLLQGELSFSPKNPNADGEFCNDLVVNSEGQIWFTDRINRQVIYLDPDGSARPVATGFRTNGLILSADESMLAVTDSIEPKLWAFRVQPNGDLEELPDFFDSIKMVDTIGVNESARGRPGTNGMTVDSDGRYYVTSFYGIQVFDSNGKYVGAIANPKGFRSNITFGGKDLNILYASGVNAVYALETKVKGAPYFLRAESD